MENLFWIVIVIAVIIVLCILYVAITYNKLVKLNNETKEGFSTMDVYLKKRWDLIPNIVEVVEGYAKHEKETLKEIVDMRNSVKSYDNLSDEQKIKTNKQITEGITKLMALAEAYPDLKANTNFLSLQQSLSEIEDEIAQSRKYYNAVVKNYNNKVEMIPSNIVAKILGYKSKTMFETSETITGIFKPVRIPEDSSNLPKRYKVKSVGN